MQVDVVSTVLPTGAATESTLSTLDGKVTACNTGAVVLAAGTAEIGKLAAGTAAIGSVTLGAGSAEIGKLAAGTAAIGKLAANSGVDIGDVDVTSVAIPSAIYHGKKTVTAGTDEAIGASQAITSGVNVKALAGNSGLIYVGKVNVSSADGYELSANESVFI